MSIKILARIKKFLTLVIIQLSQSIMIIQKKLFVGKMEGETAGVAIEEFIGLKSKVYSYLVDENSVHKKAKSVNKNYVAVISHYEYKDICWIKKCLRHSIYRIQSKDYWIGIYEINKISLSCFDEKIHIQNNWADGLPLSYQS